LAAAANGRSGPCEIRVITLCFHVLVGKCGIATVDRPMLKKVAISTPSMTCEPRPVSDSDAVQYEPEVVARGLPGQPGPNTKASVNTTVQYQVRL
jgi:hypothetical protein